MVSNVCWYKNWKKKTAVLSEFTFLCLSYLVYFSELKLILFYDRVGYDSIRIFLILLPRYVEYS